MAEPGPSSGQVAAEEQPGVAPEQQQTTQKVILTPEEKNKIFGDSHMQLVDPTLKVIDMQEAQRTVIRNKLERNADHLKIFQSGLVHAVVPQVLHFPEMVIWCAENYEPERRAVLSEDKTREIISISAESISSMLRFPEELAPEVFNEEAISQFRDTKTTEAMYNFLVDHLQDKTLMVNLPCSVDSFNATTMVAFSMISQVLGLETALTIGDTHLEALYLLESLYEKEDKLHLNFCQTIAEAMHQGLSEFITRRNFRHQAYLVYLFLHQQHFFMDRFHLNLVGADHKLMPVTEWCPKVRNTPGKENLPWYIDEFMSTLYFLMYGNPLPRVIPEMVDELHPIGFSPKVDWFLFEDHTIIRVYGFPGVLQGYAPL